MKEIQDQKLPTSEKNSPQQTLRHPYEQPRLTKHGKVEELTQILSNPGPSQTPV